MEYKILYGKNEFYKNINNKTYYVYIIDSLDKEKFMNNKYQEFIDHQNNNPNETHYIGIDFEFNKISKGDRTVALIQINIENDSNTSYIFLCCPPKLKNINILINLLTHNKMIKILHGAESLDVPYLYNQLLITKENVINFNNKFYDTKMLCEYIYNKKILKQKNVKQQCSIYDALITNKIITKKKNDELDQIEERMGPIYLIDIDVYNLSADVADYAMYDVIFLPQLIKKYIKSDRKYKILLSEILAIINNNKRNIENGLNILIKIVNEINTNYFFDNNKFYTLQSVWETYYNIFYSDYKLIAMTQINYFKFFFKIVSKYIVYSNILNNYTVFKSKHIKNNNKFLFSDLFWLYKYKYTFKVFNNINQLFILDLKSFKEN